VIVLLKNMSYSISGISNILLIAGLLVYVISNIIFAIGYYCIVQKQKRVTNSHEPNQGEEENWDSHVEKTISIRNKVLLVLSTLFTMKTYKILYSNLFITRQPPPQSSEIKKNEVTLNSMINQTVVLSPNKLGKTIKKTSIGKDDQPNSKKAIRM